MRLALPVGQSTHDSNDAYGSQTLGGNVVGLKNWQDFELKDNDGNTVTITGTPARHGPEGCESNWAK